MEYSRGARVWGRGIRRARGRRERSDIALGELLHRTGEREKSRESTGNLIRCN